MFNLLQFLFLKKKECLICVQDGSESGQTIQHVHIHIIPNDKSENQFNQIDTGKNNNFEIIY